MNRRQRQAWLQDVRLAARLGHEAALDAALAGLLEEPAVAANRPLPPDMVQRVLVPGGQALAAATVPEGYLRRLATAPYAALRALAAAALARRFAQGRATSQALEPLARDARAEVHDALQAVLSTAPQPRLAALVRAWLIPRQPPRSPRAVALAWELAPLALPPSELWDQAARWVRHEAFAALEPAIVRALLAAAKADPALALQQLRTGLAQRRWPPTLAARVLGGPWAAAHAAEVLPLLRGLYARHGRRRWLTQALQALARRGAIDDPEAVLRAWEQTPTP